VVEPNVTATLTERDSYIWLDNDVEFFLAGEDCYYELEVNAFGTRYEVFFVEQAALTPSSRFLPEFDLYRRDVDVLAGFQDTSRNGRYPKRWAFRDWDFPGLRTAVRIDGRINDPSHTDNGWTLELALPWAGMASLFGGRALPPEPGESLRAQFFRFELVDAPDGQASLGWALNSHGVYDSHVLDRFAHLVFE
jgi:hypothetical protein